MASQIRGSRDLRRSLLIRSLRLDTPSSLVRKEFEKFGTIKDVYLPLDYRSRKPRGFGFVEYIEEEDAKAAAEKMNGAILNGVPISVTFAQEGRKSPESMRYREYLSYNTGNKRRNTSRYGSRVYNKSDPYRCHSPRNYKDKFRKYWNSSNRSRSRSPITSSTDDCNMKNNYFRNEYEKFNEYNNRETNENLNNNSGEYNKSKKRILEKNFSNTNLNEKSNKNSQPNQSRIRNKTNKREYNDARGSRVFVEDGEGNKDCKSEGEYSTSNTKNYKSRSRSLEFDQENSSDKEMESKSIQSNQDDRFIDEYSEETGLTFK